MKKLEELGVSLTPWQGVEHKNEVAIITSAGFDDLRSALCRGPRRKSNSSLIAAAPKMYKMAYELIEAFDRRELTPKHIDDLRSALAEASGESEVSNGK